MRQSRCKEIYKSVEVKKPELTKTIRDYTLLADKLITVCIKDVGHSKNVSIPIFINIYNEIITYVKNLISESKSDKRLQGSTQAFGFTRVQ